MKTLFHLLLGLSLSLPVPAFASIAKDTLGQYYTRLALGAIEQGDRQAFASNLTCAEEAFREQDDMESWLKLFKEAGKSWRDSGGPDGNEQAVAVMEEGLQADFGRQPQSAEEWDALIWLQVNLGYVHFHHRDDYQEALHAYREAYHLFQKHFETEDYYTVNYIYQPLAILYIRLGDFQTAISLLKTCYQFFQRTGHSSGIVRVLNDLVIAEELSGNLQAALHHLDEGLAQGSLSPKNQVLLQSAKARVLRSAGQQEEALAAITRAFAELPKVNIPPSNLREWEGHLWSTRGSIATELGHWPEALRSFEAGEALLRQESNISYRLALAEILVGKAGLLRQQGAYEKALHAYQEALGIMVPGYEPAAFKVPAEDKLYGENMLLQALGGQVKTLRQWYHAAGGMEKLATGLAASQRIFQVEKLLRRKFQDEGSELYSVQDIRGWSENAVLTALDLWKATGDPIHKATAFQFAERGKSVLLLESIAKANAEVQGGLPEDILARERHLQRKTASLEEQVFQLKSQSAADSLVIAAEQELVRTRQAYTAWIDTLEQRYPDYFRMKYDLEMPAVAELQAQLLEDGQGLVEYFLGQETAIAFVMTPTSLEVVELDVDYPLTDQVQAFRASIEQFQNKAANRQQLCEVYRALGHRLYQELIAPLEAATDLPRRLLVVPSGVLGLLPFDALLTAPVAGCAFAEMPYLLHQHEISYAYSAAFQRAVMQRPSNRLLSASFAPEFDGTGGFGALTYTSELAATVAELTGGTAYQGQAATIAQLQLVAEAAGVLHLATHAQANPKAENFSFIAFANGRGGYDSLFVKDIYLLPLQTELVVLSACETFFGKVYHGEGVINLARSFLSAGANSVVATLWSVNDETSYNLMAHFYRQLTAGQTRPGALHQAKLKQIREGGRLGAHPVYWAGFTSVGKTSPLYRPYWQRYLLWGGVVVCGLFIGFRYQRRAS